MSLIEYFEGLRDRARERMDVHSVNGNWDGFNYQLGQVIAFGIAIRKLETPEPEFNACKALESKAIEP